MSVASMTETSQVVAEWIKLFPRQVTETYTSSVTFMKQLTVVAISTITYLKNIFPEDSFTCESFGGVKLRILKKKCTNDFAQFVSTALTQAFDAFDKKYLHQLALCFYEGQCSAANLVECHVFEFTYSEAGASMELRSKTRDSRRPARFTFDDVRYSTTQLIRACVIVMQTAQQEPRDCDVSLRLYYNDAAPAEYQAPGFAAAPAGADHLAGTADGALLLGCVQTAHHGLRAHSFFRDTVNSSHEANASQNPPVMTQNVEEFEGESEVVHGSTADSKSENDFEIIPQVCCPCNKYCHEDDNDPSTVLLTCEYCGTSQHAACFGVDTSGGPGAGAGAGAGHCCMRCSDADATRVPADPRLVPLSTNKRESLCIYRRVLVWCAGAANVSVASLGERFELSSIIARKLIEAIHTYGVFDTPALHEDPSTPLKIIPEKLKLLMNQFFVRNETDMVDRLLVETLSQGSHSDPVGDVLAPMEKVNLYNATTLGKVVEPTPPGNFRDSILKEYRDAVLSNYQIDEDLPLSGSQHSVQDMDTIGKRRTKRKIEQERRPLRSGVRTKRAKTTPK